ncbi:MULTISPECIES: hypothetical protein [unclassified Microbacterium]|uniref:hypothetical protein n=1 Tax=unclassified Microbacterium TaxID=2609290 RepID=UPI0038653C93
MTTDTGRDTTTESVAAAVCAEISRQGKARAAIAPVIGVTAPTAYSRLRGDTPFTMKELGQVARFLGMTAYDLMESAAFGDKIAARNPTDEVEQTLPVDPWAQPARSQRRGTR